MVARISYKIALGVGGVTIVILGVFSYLIHKDHQRHLLNDMEIRGHELSETIKSSTRYDMLMNQRESVHRIISTIGSQEGIEKVRIFNKEGEIILSTDPDDQGHMVDKQTEACYRCHEADHPLERLPVSERTRVFDAASGTPTFGIINPIYNEPSCWQSSCHAHTSDQTVLGVLDITMSLEDAVRAGRTNLIRLVVFALFAVAAISAMIVWLVSRIVLKPVGRIVEATQKVAEGDLSHAIQIRKRDEIGKLGEAFNEMTATLADTQRQLIQSNRLSSIGRLAAGVAHEINNPLTGVLTYSSFLLKQVEDRPDLKEDLEVVVRETQRCREIVKGLLDFSRQSYSDRRPMQLNDAISNACRIVKNQLSIQNIRIDLQLDESLPLVNADTNRMQQVMVNLLVNAGDAMEEKGGTITITSEPASRKEFGEKDESENGGVRVRVTDTGCGIPAENLGTIFEPFFSTKGVKGNGLGLAIVWGIIERHNGLLKVESTVDVGTTFTLLLPVAKTKAIAS